ncbi:hypothetical protein CcrBL47_gp421 [Caulobacter phage BL47]|nr:hypothetical protein CcrBL47_gp421 [Caulobacter phage BL47]
MDIRTTVHVRRSYPIPASTDTYNVDVHVKPEDYDFDQITKACDAQYAAFLASMKVRYPG